MKKLLFVCLCFLFSLTCLADKYAEVTVVQTGNTNKVVAFFDDGTTKARKVKPESGGRFISPVAVVNHFKEKGWTIKEVHMSISLAETIRVYVLSKKDERTAKHIGNNK